MYSGSVILCVCVCVKTGIWQVGGCTSHHKLSNYERPSAFSLAHTTQLLIRFNNLRHDCLCVSLPLPFWPVG